MSEWKPRKANYDARNRYHKFATATPLEALIESYETIDPKRHTFKINSEEIITLNIDEIFKDIERQTLEVIGLDEVTEGSANKLKTLGLVRNTLLDTLALYVNEIKGK